MRAYLVLLHVGFSVPAVFPRLRWALTPPFHPYLWLRLSPQPIGGLLSVPLSVGLRRLAVSQHVALWSPDFPLVNACAFHQRQPD